LLGGFSIYRVLTVRVYRRTSQNITLTSSILRKNLESFFSQQLRAFITMKIVQLNRGWKGPMTKYQSLFNKKNNSTGATGFQEGLQ
jgi:hypothetical protein